MTRSQGRRIALCLAILGLTPNASAEPFYCDGCSPFPPPSLEQRIRSSFEGATFVARGTVQPVGDPLKPRGAYAEQGVLRVTLTLDKTYKGRALAAPLAVKEFLIVFGPRPIERSDTDATSGRASLDQLSDELRDLERPVARGGLQRDEYAQRQERLLARPERHRRSNGGMRLRLSRPTPF